MAGVERDGRIRVDMHLHTAQSFDCRSKPEAVLERAHAVGLDRICVTDHNQVDAALGLRERYPDRVIVGEEVKTAEGVDIIGLFVDERIPGGTPALETCERIHDQSGIVYVPHPFVGGKGGGGRLLPEIEDHIDVLEAFNARVRPTTLNERAARWARERGLPTGAGSDAHTLGEVGRAWIEVEPFEDGPAAFLAALAHATIHGRTSSPFVHIASLAARVLP